MSVEYKDRVVFLLSEILKAIKALKKKSKSRKVQGDLWQRGKKMDRIDVATMEYEESQEKLRQELARERARKGASVGMNGTGTSSCGPSRSTAKADAVSETTTSGPKVSTTTASRDGIALAPNIDHREAKHGVVNGEAAKIAEQLMAKNRRMLG